MLSDPAQGTGPGRRIPPQVDRLPDRPIPELLRYFLAAAMTLILPWNESLHQTQHGTPGRTKVPRVPRGRRRTPRHRGDPCEYRAVEMPVDRPPSHNGNMTISARDRKLLWALAYSSCARCRCPLVEKAVGAARSAVIGEEAHIVSRSADGPRGHEAPPAGGWDGYDNFVLLCPRCHSVVDQQWRAWPASRLRQLKIDHEAWGDHAIRARSPGTWGPVTMEAALQTLEKSLPHTMTMVTPYVIGATPFLATLRTHFGEVLVHADLSIGENPGADWFLILDRLIDELRPEHDVRAGLILTRLFPASGNLVVYPRTRVWLYMMETDAGHAETHLTETLSGIEEKIADYPGLVSTIAQWWPNRPGHSPSAC